MEKNIFLLEDKILEIQSQIVDKKLKFRNITQLEYTPLTDTIEPKYEKNNLYKSPKYKIYLSNLELSDNTLLLAKSATIPNVTLNLGYNQRVNRDDYLFISLMFPLQIYGREASKIEEQSNLVTKTQNTQLGYKLNVEKEFASLEENLTYLNKRVVALKTLITQYTQLLNYNENNINTSNILKTLEVQNSLIDFEILKKSLELQIITTLLQLEYLTSEDLS